ncbi:MAG: hypothetical protein PUC76_05360 [Clostridia bacterium]|nr:hypothetical protein [Clostridia bacterium]
MNYFGLFFTFMIPGIIIGTMAAAAAKQAADRRRRQAVKACREAMRTVPRNKLYICTLEKDAKAA